MFSELTKGQDVQVPTITPEMISAAVTQSAARMDSVQKEALDKFGQALTEFLKSTLEHLTKPKSDQSGSKGEKSQMDISSAFISEALFSHCQRPVHT